MLHDGVILFVGTPEEITASRNPIVRQFVTEALRIPSSAMGNFYQEEKLDEKR
jgi:ABC-type transporter Mla maintaining outer membrane lipid asymmetry ATPase subunit MlaF